MSDEIRLDWRTFLPVGSRGWLWRTADFTAAEVRRLLAGGATCPRGQAVRRCVARTGDWLPPESDVVRCPWWYHRHLPRIVFWHAQGESPEAIGRRLGLHARAWEVERVLDEACRCIAACLNDAPQDYGL